jgi:hypothetical protein
VIKKGLFHQYLIPIAVILVAGLAVMGLEFGLYAVFHQLLARVIPRDPAAGVPTLGTRPVFAAIMALVYLLAYRTKIGELAKATLAVVPTAVLMVTAGISLYQWPVAGRLAQVAIYGVVVLLLYRARKPWTYYFAVTLAALVSVAYA